LIKAQLEQVLAIAFVAVIKPNGIAIAFES
jgi:hypothetical protein